MRTDEMIVTVLEDGSIKIETDRISQQNHSTAEALLKGLAKLCGGIQRRRHKHGVVGHAVHRVQHMLGSAHRH